MRSLIFSQCRDRRIRVIRLDLGALTAARARELEPGDLKLGQVVIKRVAVVELRVNNGSGDGGSCFGIEVWTDTENAKTDRERADAISTSDKFRAEQRNCKTLQAL